MKSELPLNIESEIQETGSFEQNYATTDMPSTVARDLTLFDGTEAHTDTGVDVVVDIDVDIDVDTHVDHN